MRNKMYVRNTIIDFSFFKNNFFFFQNTENIINICFMMYTKTNHIIDSLCTHKHVKCVKIERRSLFKDTHVKINEF